MILVTAAAGKSGLAVIRALQRHGAEVRAFVHRQEQASAMQALGVADCVVGDLHDARTLARAMEGIVAVYHIPPAVQPGEAELGKGVIAAAKAAGVGSFVFHSVMHPQISAIPHHAGKLQVEDALIQSALPYTILQPSSYMQNVGSDIPRIAQQGVYACAYGMRAPMSLVDLDDVGEAAAIVLTEDGHRYATYELAGPEVLTAEKMAAILSEKLGRPVTAEGMNVDQWAARMRGFRMGDHSIAMLSAMFRYYAEHGFTGNPTVLAYLLRRPPTTYAEFVESVLKVSR